MKCYLQLLFLVVPSVFIKAMDKHSPRELKGEAFDLPEQNECSIARFLEKNQISPHYAEQVMEILNHEYNPYCKDADLHLKKLMIWELFFYIRNGRLCKKNEKRIDEEYYYDVDPHQVLRRLCVAVDKLKRSASFKFLKSKKLTSRRYIELYYVK